MGWCLDLFQLKNCSPVAIFDAEIVVLCVRWYLSFKLSYRDLVGMKSERGIRLVHTTILNIARSKDRC